MRVLLYLPLLFALACRASVETIPLRIPGIPDEVPSQLGPVKVMVVDSIVGGDPRMNLMGGFDAWKRVIYLRRALSPLQALHTLHHERCHVTAFDSGVRQLIHPQLMDAICDAFASVAVAEILSSGKP